MKAIIQTAFGYKFDEVLQIQEVDKPKLKDDEVLIKVFASTIHADSWHSITGNPSIMHIMGAGFSKPSFPIPGSDVAGIVEEIGKKATRFAVGDAVYGSTCPAMMLWKNNGGWSEYAACPEDLLSLKPENASFEEAVCVPTSGIISILNLPIESEFKPGYRVLINGAAGTVGSMAIQIAKARGAHVTGVDSAEKLELVAKLGADRVVDYKKDDFTKEKDVKYDLIFDVASVLSVSDCEPVLTPTGRYVMIGHDHFGATNHSIIGSVGKMVGLMFRSIRNPHLSMPNNATPTKDILKNLHELFCDGKIRPVVGKTFALGEIVEAMKCLVGGSVIGRLVLTPQS